ncbi:FtsK/SpoIIIE domain-containing protein [Catellatospora chokoriensis]|uniref:Cell division protein FtsK n=1 Tax=Catellatospora chokoriensis TaxID=310353 RepID=A0A8J3K1T1_9ACTN|nr:FtsK/SpoIIIE domain-containing protein [Catellatospora chokoriensis]GIF91381.1 cell division protein FtsK [Catellatospora chokoriensis]
MTTRPVGIPDEPEPHGEAEVFDLDTARARRQPRPNDHAQGDSPDLDEGTDAEAVDYAPAPLGNPVDPTDAAPAGVWARQPLPTKPIVPDWARSRADLYLTARWGLKYVGYLAAYHTSRSPKYLLKTAWYGLLGTGVSAGRLVKWAMAEEGNFGLRQHAANTNQAELWLKLDKQRQSESVWRWWVAAPTLLGGAGTVAYLAVGPVPAWWGITVAAVAAPVFAQFGRPADARITDRVTQGATYRKLTAELVRRALTSLGIAGINSAVAKDAGAITFPTEIHRDGPGHMAVIDLPYGVEASDVIARRGRLASALRLPMDQVWPEASRTHTGRLHLWVGFEPASAMRQPAWPLVDGKKVDLFAPFPFATDPRLRTKNAEVMFRNWLFGGQPGSGKTFALRVLVLATLLDPRAEVRGYELKGVGDFSDVAALLAEYGNGMDDDTIARAAAFVDWLFEECQRRSKRIAHFKAKGMAPDGKVTPELASLKGSGLHPLVAFIDEVQNLFAHKTFGKQAGEVAELVIKLGRALGVILLLGTQIPDKASLPTGITRNVSNRFCLSVADQIANDMILGTSMYQNGHRATVFEPGEDSGWGIAVGLGKPAPYRSFLLTEADVRKVVERATGYRRDAGTLPAATAERTAAPVYDLLGDLSTVWPAGAKSALNSVLCAALAELRPEIYTGWESAQLTAALKPHRAVTVTTVAGPRVEGKSTAGRGIRLDDLTAAITERNRKRGGN